MTHSDSTGEKKWRILCIDDDPDVLLILQSSLGIHHEVVTADNGVEAIAMLDVCDADFIICDVHMPTMDGFQTVEAIRRHPGYADIPVFFLTAETNRKMAQRGFESGANLYLTKPFDPMRLLKNIEYFLQESGHQPRRKRLTREAAMQAATAHPPSPSPAESQAPAAAGAQPVGRSPVKARPDAARSDKARPDAARADVARADADKTRADVARANAARSDAARAGKARSGRARIIVICANRPQLARIRAALQALFECVACADPLASLQQIFRYEPDILMINPAVPKLSGWGLVQMIQQNPRLKTMPVILVDDDEKAVDPRLVPAITKFPVLAATAAPAEIMAAVENVTKSKGFAVRPKRAPLEALAREEEQMRAEMREEKLRQTREEVSRKNRFRKIQEFIDTQLT